MSPALPTSFLATRRGKITLVLLCSVAFLDFVDVSIVNVALPSIRGDLHMSVQSLQWIPSAYLLTYGGIMLLGGRAADLLGRRRVLVAGTVLFAVASLFAGFAGNSGVLISARLAQGVGAALMLPAALSTLTTLFREGSERNIAFGAWGGVAGVGSAVGVLLGGVLTQDAGWRWVFFVNPPICLLEIVAIFLLLKGERHRAPLKNFDVLGALLATGGMLLLVYALVRAPVVGWGNWRTLCELAAALIILIAFVVNEQRSRNPLLPMSIFQIKGLGAADVCMLISAAGFVTMFFFLTLYMQDVLLFSPIRTGLSYLPVTGGVVVAAGIASKFVSRVGTRPFIAGGTFVGAVGVSYLARCPVHGSYLVDVLPGMVIMAIGLGGAFVAVTTAANVGVPSEQAGLAAALLNASQQIGAAIGLAIFSAIATSRTDALLASHHSESLALASGFHRGLLAAGIFLFVSSFVALRSTNTRGTIAVDAGASTIAASL